MRLQGLKHLWEWMKDGTISEKGGKCGQKRLWAVEGQKKEKDRWEEEVERGCWQQFSIANMRTEQIQSCCWNTTVGDNEWLPHKKLSVIVKNCLTDMTHWNAMMVFGSGFEQVDKQLSYRGWRQPSELHRGLKEYVETESSLILAWCWLEAWASNKLSQTSFSSRRSHNLIPIVSLPSFQSEIDDLVSKEPVNIV